MSYTIRPVQPKDNPIARTAIQQMHFDAFPGYPMIETNVGYWWIAYDAKSKPAAFSSLWPSVRSPVTGYLARAAVDEKHRGRGLQRRLIRVREAKARSLGWLVTVSDTNRENIHSANNMIRCGYLLHDPPVAWGHKESLYWRRILTPGAA